jgi:hypothetical protein
MKFRKRPVVIEAIQFFKNSQPWPDGVLEAPCLCAEEADNFWIETLEGHHHVSDGDWIITGVQQEKYPCKPDIFEQTYEPVEE